MELRRRHFPAALRILSAAAWAYYFAENTTFSPGDSTRSGDRYFLLAEAAEKRCRSEVFSIAAEDDVGVTKEEKKIRSSESSRKTSENEVLSDSVDLTNLIASFLGGARDRLRFLRVSRTFLTAASSSNGRIGAPRRAVFFHSLHLDGRDRSSRGRKLGWERLSSGWTAKVYESVGPWIVREDRCRDTVDLWGGFDASSPSTSNRDGKKSGGKIKCSKGWWSGDESEHMETQLKIPDCEDVLFGNEFGKELIRTKSTLESDEVVIGKDFSENFSMGGVLIERDSRIGLWSERKHSWLPLGTGGVLLNGDKWAQTRRRMRHAARDTQMKYVVVLQLLY